MRKIISIITIMTALLIISCTQDNPTQINGGNSSIQADMSWLKQCGGINEDNVRGITVDAEGNQFIIGDFYTTAKFGSINLISNGFVDIFVAKLDSLGNVLWAKNAGGVSRDEGKSICLDKFGNVYISGMFWKTAQFGSYQLNSVSNYGDGFIAKLDTDGNFLWAKEMGAAFDGEFSSIVLDSANNIFGAGFTRATSTDSNYNDIYIAKLNCDGGVLWSKTIGGQGWDHANSLAIDNGGNLYIAGSFEKTVLFGLDSFFSLGSCDIFVSKIDMDGNIKWTKQAGGIYPDEALTIAVDLTGSCYIGGYFIGATKLGETSFNCLGLCDGFFAKMDNNGNFVLAKQIGSLGFDQVNSIKIDCFSNVLLTGAFSYNAVFGSTSLIAKGTKSDMFLVKMDADCNYQWALSAGGENNDQGISITLNKLNDVFVAGTFKGKAMFGIDSLNAAGGAEDYDIYIAKYKEK